MDFWVLFYFLNLVIIVFSITRTEINSKQRNIFFLIVKALMANISLNHGFIFFLISENIHSHSQRMILNF